MKLTRRDFLKDGAITALALAVGLKPDEIIRSPVVDISHFSKASVIAVGDTHIGDYHSRVAEVAFGPDFTPAQRQLGKRQSFNELYGGGAGAGKTGCGGFLLPPRCYKRLLAMSDVSAPHTHYEADVQFDPDEQVLTYLGFVVTPMMFLKEVA